MLTTCRINGHSQPIKPEPVQLENALIKARVYKKTDISIRVK